jgi:hypothetical protein
MILTLPFLGDRTYLHGTTLFDALLPHCPRDAALSFKISRMIETDRVEVSSIVGNTDAHASITWEGGGLEVAPVTPSANLVRQDYDESRVTSAVEFAPDKRSATFASEPPFSFVATLVPLYKTLLSRNQHGDRVGQWLFTRLDITGVPTRFVPLTLTYAGSLGRGSIARSRISADGSELGLVYFSWLDPR